VTSALRPLAALLAALALAGPAPAQQAARKAQQIVFPELPARMVTDAPFQLTAHATSRLAVTYVVVDGPAVLDGKSTLRLTGQPGLVIVRAAQAGNTVFAPATDAERAFAVNAQAAAAAFRLQPSDARATVGGMIVLSASATGEPKPAYQWRHNGVEVPGATQPRLTISSAAPADAGTYVVSASNTLGTTTSVPVQVVVGKRSQSIIFSQVPPVTAGQTITLAATATSGLPVRFDVVSGLATVNGQVLTVTSGIISIQASQPGDGTYDAAQPVSQSIIVNPSRTGSSLGR
jgi:hypothetical protein